MLEEGQVDKARPFLRWAGGKRWLIKTVHELVSNIDYNNYHEPFLGGGAIFFALMPKGKAYLADFNKELINTYKQVKNNPCKIIDGLKILENKEQSYYKIRESVPNNEIDQAIKFIYLNHTSFNGIYRVNSYGKYNVPYGFRKNYLIDEKKISIASIALKKTYLRGGDFIISKQHIRKNDLVFLDPPYTVSHNNNGFIEYNKKLFSLNDQERLSEFIDYIKSIGAYYILTNAAHKTIKDIFTKDGDTMLELNRGNTIGGKNAARGQTTEYLFTNIKIKNKKEVK
jgi:DNA adenine methylase